MCSPSHLLRCLHPDTCSTFKAGFSLGVVTRHRRPSSSSLAKAGGFPRPLFPFSQRKGSEPARRPGPARERPAERPLAPRDQAQPSSPSLSPWKEPPCWRSPTGVTRRRPPVTHQLLNLPSGTPATAAGAGHCSLELHRAGSGLPAPCRDAMALPENAAAYSRGSGKRNEDLVLQRPSKATL